MQESEGEEEQGLGWSRGQLEMVRGEGVKALSEMCTVSVAHLLQYTAALLANEQPAAGEGGLRWPLDAAAKAQLLKAHTLHMVRLQVTTVDNL